MATFVNTRDTMSGSTDEERAQQVLDGLVSHTLTEFKEDGITYVGQCALRYNTGLETVELPNLVYTSSVSNSNTYLFQKCTALKDVKLESLTRVPSYIFSGCTALESVKFSDSLNYLEYYGFENCGLEVFDTKSSDAISITVNSNALTSSKIKHFIIRSATRATLSNVSAFYACPIRLGDGGIYVPSALLDSYKSATNWSTYAANIYPIVLDGNNEVVLRTNFDSIEDSWEDILAAEEDGTYSTKYSVGDTKSVEIGNKTVKMQIAAFDVDTIAGTSDKAKITWVCKNFYADSEKMNSTSTTAGGWPASAMYSYLNDSTNGIYNSIDSTVKAAIKTVVKPYWDAATSTEETSNDKLWLLSNQEVNFVTNGSYHKEGGGVTYSGLFPTASNSGSTNRVKYDSSYFTYIWWLRSSYSSSSFVYVDTYGSANGYSAYGTFGVVFGFCT